MCRTKIIEFGFTFTAFLMHVKYKNTYKQSIQLVICFFYESYIATVIAKHKKSMKKC